MRKCSGVSSAGPKAISQQMRTEKTAAAEKESSQEKEMTNLMSWWRHSGNADRTKHYEAVHIFIDTIVVYMQNGNNWSPVRASANWLELCC